MEARTDGPPQLPARRVALVLGAGFAATLVLMASCDPISQDESHAGRMWLALIAIALLGLRFGHRRFAPGLAATRVRWLSAALLASACVYGIANYYQFDGRKITDLHSYEDTTYYYVNSKYFDELSYFSLYPAMLMADEERPADDRLLDEIKRYRDLSTYRLRTRRLSADERDQIRRAFTDARWQAFGHDVHELVRRWPGGKSYFFTDHGYNPPPTWTVVGGTLSSMVPVEHVWLLAKIDLVLLVGLLGLMARTYGAETAAYALLFFVTTYSGRWPMLGDSILRFDWCVALVAGTCFLRTKHMLAAGGCLAYAALNRVFPAIFFFPIGVAFALQWRRSGTVSIDHKRFVVGAAATTVALIGGALLAYGVDAFVASKDNLLLHQSSASFSRYRIGFGAALGFRAEHTGAALAAAGGIGAKARVLDEYAWFIKALAAFLLALIAWWGHRSRWSADRLLPLAIAPLFVLTNPQINYFNLRLLLIAWHFLAPDRGRNQFGLVALFAIEAMTQASHVAGNDRYATMAYTSIGLCLYFVVIFASLAIEARQPSLGQRHASLMALIGVGALALMYAATWRAGSAIDDRRVSARQLATVQDSGARWDGPGTVRILPDQTLHIVFDDPASARAIDISFDNNDRYTLRLFRDDVELGQLTVERHGSGRAKGLWRERFELAERLVGQPFDRIDVTAEGGDGTYALGHLIVEQ